jgi:hypothetical protein
MRKNIRNSNLLKKKEKQRREKIKGNQIIENYFKKWKNMPSNYEEISSKKIIKKLIKLKRQKKEEENKKENEIKNDKLINKFKKVILQSLLRLYKQKKMKYSINI